MNRDGSTTIARDMIGALLAVAAAVLVCGIVPLGTPVLVGALLVAGVIWRRSAPGNPAQYVLLVGGGILAIVMMVMLGVLFFGLTV